MRKQYIAKFSDHKMARQFSSQRRDDTDVTHLVVEADNAKDRWEVWTAEDYWAYIYHFNLTQKQSDYLYNLIDCFTLSSSDKENETYG